MRVLTLNLWGRHGDWPVRRALLVDGLRALRPDLVAFQEVITGPGDDGAADLLGPGYEVVHQRLNLLGDGNGTAVASRWPIVATDEVDLAVTPRTADFPTSAILVEVDAPAPVGAVVFVNHKPSWRRGLERERELQAVATAAAIEEVTAGRDLHVVVAGDMDAVPDSAGIRFWTGRQSLEGASVCYRDAWEAVHGGDPGHTFTPENPLVTSGDAPLELGRRIDYVLVRCGPHGPTLRVRRCERAFAAPRAGVWASDHFGVVADLDAPDA